MPNKPSNATVIEKSTQHLRALASYADPKERIAVNGVQHVAEEIAAIFQATLDTRAALARKRAEVQEAMAACAKADEARREAVRALKAWAVHRFGVTSKEALEFGFPPPRATTMTVEEKAQAVRRAQATRDARRTMGTRQREKIRGALPALASHAVAPPTSVMTDPP